MQTWYKAVSTFSCLQAAAIKKLFLQFASLSQKLFFWALQFHLKPQKWLNWPKTEQHTLFITRIVAVLQLLALSLSWLMKILIASLIFCHSHFWKTEKPKAERGKAADQQFSWKGDNPYQIPPTSMSLQIKTITDKAKRKDSTFSNLDAENICIETFAKKCSVGEIIHEVLTFPV